MRLTKVIAALVTVSGVCLAAEELPDPDFLEWLGMIAEAEELGVDVDTIIESQDDESGRSPQPEDTQ